MAGCSAVTACSRRTILHESSSCTKTIVHCLCAVKALHEVGFIQTADLSRSLKRYYPPPELRVSAVAQRREETLNAVPELAYLPPDVRAVFEAAAEMGLPPCVVRDVVRRYAALGMQPVGLGSAAVPGAAAPAGIAEGQTAAASDEELLSV